jgi:hypothetical protein
MIAPSSPSAPDWLPSLPANETREPHRATPERAEVFLVERFALGNTNGNICTLVSGFPAMSNARRVRSCTRPTRFGGTASNP